MGPNCERMSGLHIDQLERRNKMLTDQPISVIRKLSIYALVVPWLSKECSPSSKEDASPSNEFHSIPILQKNLVCRLFLNFLNKLRCSSDFNYLERSKGPDHC